MRAFAAADFFWLFILLWFAGADFLARPKFPPGVTQRWHVEKQTSEITSSVRYVGQPELRGIAEHSGSEFENRAMLFSLRAGLNPKMAVQSLRTLAQ